MFGLKISCVLLFYVVALNKCESPKDAELSESYCDGTGWASYKDENCFKLVKKPLTREEAKDVCEQEESQLVSIRSLAEQAYLTEYVFNKSAAVVNVWIGAKRSNENEFVWDDGRKVDFTNWAADSPTGEAQRGCTVMQAEFTSQSTGPSERIGKWRDVICEQWNFAVCEKLQKWSIVKLQQTLLDTRKDFKDSLDQVTDELNATKKQLIIAQNQLSTTQNGLSETKAELGAAKGELSATKSELSATKNELSQTNTRLSSAESQIDASKKNSVPIGFIYVQLPNEKTPTEIWPLMQWTDVSTAYSGVFFRVNGGDAAAFGQVQEENSPRLSQVRTGAALHMSNMKTPIRPWDVDSSIPKTGWSHAVPTGTYYANTVIYTAFEHSSGEIRPRNMAVRIWKRTT